MDLLRELAARIAAAAGTADPIRLSVSIAGAARGLLSLPRPLDAELASLLRARGIRLAPAAADTASAERMPYVRVTCGDSLSDVVCTADVARADAPAAAIVVSRPRSAFDRPDRSTPLVVIELRPLYGQWRPLLDVAPLDERRLLLLDTNDVRLVEAGEEGWREVATRPLPPVTWPRDPRGRVTVDGRVFDAFVPGLHCRGTLDPFDVSCAEGRDAWPLPLENSGLAEGRNFFTSPRTASFFSAAAPSAPGAAWAVAGVDGKLRLLDDAFRETGAFGGHGDDVVALRIGCGLSRRLLVMTPADSEAMLGAYEIDARQVQPRSAAAVLPGPLTALWQADEERAIAIAHNVGLERYEAFVVRLACVR